MKLLKSIGRRLAGFKASVVGETLRQFDPLPPDHAGWTTRLSIRRRPGKTPYLHVRAEQSGETMTVPFSPQLADQLQSIAEEIRKQSDVSSTASTSTPIR